MPRKSTEPHPTAARPTAPGQRSRYNLNGEAYRRHRSPFSHWPGSESGAVSGRAPADGPPRPCVVHRTARPIAGYRLHPVLTAPVSAVPAPFATARARPGSFRPVKPPPAPPAPLEAVLTGRNGPGRARTVANRAGTALTGAVRTGHHTDAATSHQKQPAAPTTARLLAGCVGLAVCLMEY